MLQIVQKVDNFNANTYTISNEQKFQMEKESNPLEPPAVNIEFVDKVVKIMTEQTQFKKELQNMSNIKTGILLFDIKNEKTE